MLTNGDFASIFLLVAAILYSARKYLSAPRAVFCSTWAIRVFFSLFVSFFINAVCISKKPVSLLFMTALMVIFLIESFRLWRLTGIFTEIDLSIFPRFKQCAETFIWPIGKFFDSMRESILARGFKEAALLKIGGGDRFVMYSPVFYSKDKYSRLQIIFDSLRIGRPLVNCIITSFPKAGEAIVTNNLQTVFAAFYPQSWNVRRCPMASVEDLLKIHAARINKKHLRKMNDENSFEAINSEQHQIELENCRAGLCEKLDENTNITLTFAGRYHLWCDMLTYSYFGKHI